MDASMSPDAAATPPLPQRRELLHGIACMGAACLAGPLTLAHGESPLTVRRYGRTQLVDELGKPFGAAQLRPGEPFVFNYPYESTPVFLMALPRPVAPVELADEQRHRYLSLAGVGPQRSIVAYSAICAHKLMYPTPQISFINIRKGQGAEPPHVVHCCGDDSRYDPTQGGRVISGPAPQPLAMVVLEWSADSDEMHAVGTLGGEMFQAFFEKYDFRLTLDHGANARRESARTAVVKSAASYSRQLQSCKV